MPDIVIIWNTDATITTELLIQKHGLVRAPAPSCGVAPFYTGNHFPNAFAVSVGPDVPHGTVRDGGSVLDIAPTILSHFGIDPPSHMGLSRCLHEQ